VILFLGGFIAGIIVYDLCKIILRQDSHYKRQIKKREGKK
jgi:hypothetical protein